MARYLSIFLFVMGATGCGYTLRGLERPFFEKHNIRTLYISPVKNDSFRPGVEIMVYNAIRKRFAQEGSLRIVDQPNQGDAKLIASVTDANSSPGATTRADQLGPVLGAGPSNVQIAVTYQVNLAISFTLSDAKSKILWSQGISRSKPFQASTYFGTAGDTSALINESQFDDTLAQLAESAINDAVESMNAIF